MLYSEVSGLTQRFIEAYLPYHLDWHLKGFTEWDVALKLTPYLLSFLVFDYSYRDYILSWYVPLSLDEGQLYQMLAEDFWEMIKQLRTRLSEVDIVNVVCNNMVKSLHGHFCDLKASNTRYAFLVLFISHANVLAV